MNWEQIVEVWAEIEATTLRNAKTVLLASLLKEVAPEEAKLLCYLVVGRLVPLYVPLEFGMAEKSIIRTVAWGTGKSESEVLTLFKEIGDLGKVIDRCASESVGRQVGESVNQQVSLSVSQVYQQLYAVASLSGAGSQEGKVQLLGKLLKQLSPLGAKYVVRLVSGKLRLGFSDMTILDALSWGKKGSKEDRVMLEHAYNVASDLGMVAERYLDGKVDLATLRVIPGVPVRPMRAERLGTLTEIIDKLGECAVEPKLDGMRVQIHAFSVSASQFIGRSANQLIGGSVNQNGLFGEEEKDDVEIKIFSRGLEDITAMFPDVVGAARELYERVGAFVVDGEAIGIASDGMFLPFQETMKRKRKYGIEEKTDSIPLKVVLFDVLFGFGEDNLGKTYVERRNILAKMITTDEWYQTPEILIRAMSQNVTTMQELKEKFEWAMGKKLEGVLVKKLDSNYRAGARDFSWVKYKRAHEAELADTIDAVVMGAYVGKGKRMKFGVGAFLVGVRKGDVIVTVAKIGTGLTDEQFGELYEKLKVHQVENVSSEYDVPKSLAPDMWVEPSIVVEIEADEITESPLHTSGYALRFPRLLRFRNDKGIAEISQVSEVERLFSIARG